MIGVRLNAGFDFFYFLVRERKMRFGANGGFDFTKELKEMLRKKKGFRANGGFGCT